ncbi:hypothetical protein V6Z12_D05G423100 [Gossypium hirsutum]
MAINPIDRCWRYKKNSKNRKRQAKCVLGFGHKIRGGNKGEYYLVIDNSDDDVVNPKPRTLRHGVIQKRPLWIIFAHDMNIKLSQELMVESHKTIDSRGSNVYIAYECGITLQFVHNVVIHNIHIHRTVKSNGGLIRDSEDHYGYAQLAMEMAFLYLDHQGFSLIIFPCLSVRTDTSMQYKVPLPLPSQIAISPHHDHVILLTTSDTYSKDQYMQVTLAFNHFGKELMQKMPRCRWGYFHVVNNDYTHWKLYAIGGSMHPTIISQGNRFIAPNNP